jgi:hypothetical protein
MSNLKKSTTKHQPLTHSKAAKTIFLSLDGKQKADLKAASDKLLQD